MVKITKCESKKMNTSDEDNPIVAYYVTHISVPGPNNSTVITNEKGLPLRGKNLKFDKIINYINEAHGHVDGNCNMIDPETGNFVDKPGFDNYDEVCKAHHNLRMHNQIRLLVAVHKNGNKSFRILV